MSTIACNTKVTLDAINSATARFLRLPQSMERASANDHGLTVAADVPPKQLRALLFQSTFQPVRKVLPPTVAKSGDRKMADCPSYY